MFSWHAGEAAGMNSRLLSSPVSQDLNDFNDKQLFTSFAYLIANNWMELRCWVVKLTNNQVFCEFFFFFFCLFPLLSWISCSSEMKYLAGTEIVSTMWGCITFTEFALMLCMLAFERQNSIVWSSITPLLCIKVVYYEQRRETFNHTL